MAPLGTRALLLRRFAWRACTPSGARWTVKGNVQSKSRACRQTAEPAASLQAYYSVTPLPLILFDTLASIVHCWLSVCHSLPLALVDYSRSIFRSSLNLSLLSWSPGLGTRSRHHTFRGTPPRPVRGTESQLRYWKYSTEFLEDRLSIQRVVKQSPP